MTDTKPGPRPLPNPNPPPAPRCAFCRRAIHRQRNGAWYHDASASAACGSLRGGFHSTNRATPGGGSR